MTLLAPQQPPLHYSKYPFPTQQQALAASEYFISCGIFLYTRLAK